MKSETIYQPEKELKHLHLIEEQKQAVKNITLGIESVDWRVRDMALDDVVETLENGHPLNRLITNEEGDIYGYVACEDFVPGEAYVKYFGSTGNLKNNLFKELPAFFEYAKQKGYNKLNFHGWNERLNHVLRRFGFERVRTDSMDDLSADFYEKILVEEKDKKTIAEERRKAFEKKYINKIKKEYEKTLKSFKEDKRQQKEQHILKTFGALDERLKNSEDIEIGEKQRVILKLKLARYFQKNNTCDAETLYDAIIETPKFINTDKGSLNRLFEVHEQKTLEKIAQIRKQRAEMGDKDGFNPYEALLRTDSGKYYLARLLNMPHLEEESEYMRNCVGTSDSYINRMKRGEIEILSIRYTPEGKSGESDKPIITIEYDPREKVIQQMKTADDEYLKKDDPYYHEVLDALDKLTQTTTDKGEKRKIKKISESELENIAVRDYYLLTKEREVSFRDFDPDKEDFVLKMGKMDITSEISKDDAARIFKIVEGVEIKPQEIAYEIKDINQNTRAYVGELQSGIFEMLEQHNIEHIYTKFPEERIERFGAEMGGKSEQEIMSELENREQLDKNDRGKIYISDYAKSMLRNEDFIKSLYENPNDHKERWRLKNREQIKFVKLTVGSLGFPDGATTDEIYEKVRELGLELCPPEAGPEMRLNYKKIFGIEQSRGEYFQIGMKQIADSAGDPHVFIVHRSDDGESWLVDYWATPDVRWYPSVQFVFRFRKLET